MFPRYTSPPPERQLLFAVLLVVNHDYYIAELHPGLKKRHALLSCPITSSFPQALMHFQPQAVLIHLSCKGCSLQDHHHHNCGECMSQLSSMFADDTASLRRTCCFGRSSSRCAADACVYVWQPHPTRKLSRCWHMWPRKKACSCLHRSASALLRSQTETSGEHCFALRLAK